MAHALLVSLIMASVASADGTVESIPRASDQSIVIPTYRLGADDLNPHFQAYEGVIYYPYTAQDNLGTTKEDVTYRALVAENEYLKVTILPEIGGRIHSVLDKTTGEQLLYLNKVIKPGLIALRGAWINGGVEWNNGPQNHTVTSFAPVSGRAFETEGAATIIVGDTEAVNGTRWEVRVTLEAGRAYIREDIHIENPTDFPAPYYFWNNAKYVHHDGVRFIIPASLMVHHGETRYSNWPIHDGVDLTWLKNYDDMTSLFAVNSVYDFFGAYDVKRDHGLVIHADHRIVNGKKAWTWGVSDFAKATLANLTDDDTGDIEVQSGPLPTQDDYGVLMPHQRVAWTEWWYPVHGLGSGYEYANAEAALETIRDPSRGELEIRALATATYENAVCVVEQPGTRWREILPAPLSPHAPAIVRTSPPEQGPVTITLKTSHDGKDLVSYTSPLPIPQESPPPEKPVQEPPGAEQHYLAAFNAYLSLDFMAARGHCEASLAIDSGYADALRLIGMLDLRQAAYEHAAVRFAEALERNPRDSYGWYCLGLAQFQQGALDDALETAYRCVRELDYAALGYDLAGRIEMRRGNAQAAREAFEKSLALNANDTAAENRFLIAGLIAGDDIAPHASRVATERPLDVIPQIVLAFARHENSRELPEWAAPIDWAMTDAATAFAELGAYERAGQILDWLIEDSRSDGLPLPRYLRAYYAHQAGDPAAAERFLAEAREGPADYVFPKSLAMFEALRFAVEMDPADARAHYYLGNLYAGIDRVGDAVAEWSSSVSLEPGLNVAHRNLGMDAWRRSKDLEAAAAHYERAIAARPSDQTLYRDLALIHTARDHSDQALELLLGMPYDERRTDVTLLLVQTYLAVERPADALEVLERETFSNREGNMQSWELFKRAHLMLGVTAHEGENFDEALNHFDAALTYPANLGVGKSPRTEEAEVYYWRGRALQALGRKDEARESFSAAANAPHGSREQERHREMSAQALAELN